MRINFGPDGLIKYGGVITFIDNEKCGWVTSAGLVSKTIIEIKTKNFFFTTYRSLMFNYLHTVMRQDTTFKEGVLGGNWCSDFINEYRHLGVNDFRVIDYFVYFISRNPCFNREKPDRFEIPVVKYKSKADNWIFVTRYIIRKEMIRIKQNGYVEFDLIYNMINMIQLYLFEECKEVIYMRVIEKEKHLDKFLMNKIREFIY